MTTPPYFRRRRQLGPTWRHWLLFSAIFLILWLAYYGAVMLEWMPDMHTLTRGANPETVLFFLSLVVYMVLYGSYVLLSELLSRRGRASDNHPPDTITHGDSSNRNP